MSDEENIFPELSGEPEVFKGKPAKKIKSFTCPACGGTIEIHAAGLTVTAACRHCSSVIDVSNENLKIIEKANKKFRNSLIPLGERGRFGGIEWEVIGLMKRSAGGSYTWDEYLLYNPYHGFRFLVEADGHWNLVKMIRKDISGAGLVDRIWIDDRKYVIFNKGFAAVDNVMGEFYWRVKTGDEVSSNDYIAPPYIATVELDASEVTVSEGYYLKPDDVQQAFPALKDKQMPSPRGVAPNQPSLYQGKLLNIWLVAAFSLLVIVFTQIITVNASDNVELFKTSNKLIRGGQYNTMMTSSFILPETTNMEILSSASVSNDWVELEYTLLNEAGEPVEIRKEAVEYYFGRGSDGYWTEGSQSESMYLSSIPPGNYRLMVEAEGGFNRVNSIDYFVTVKRDVPQWSNFWMAVILIFIYPFFTLLRHFKFETERWSNSDYAPFPYNVEHGGDDD